MLVVEMAHTGREARCDLFRTNSEDGPGNRLWPPTNCYVGMTISGTTWCAFASSISLFDTACPLIRTLALFGLASIPNPPLGGWDQPLLDIMAATGFKLVVNGHAHWALRHRGWWMDDPGTFWPCWALDILLVNAFTDQVCARSL